MAIQKINQICKAGFELHMIEDYENLVFRYEKVAKESTQENEKLRFENQRLRRITENTDGERANLKIFSTFEQEYKQILDEVLSEVKKRDEAIENLSRKQEDTEQRYREYRFVFGSVAQVEEKLKKMEGTYTDKLRSCFDHYSRTMAGVGNESEQLKLIANRLKNSDISPSKASDVLQEIVKGLETQINYFEKFFNKFKDVSDIQAVVKDYLEGKQEIRKGINKVIYLQEMAKFKENQGKPTPAEQLKLKHYASIANMDSKFKSYQKTEGQTAVKIKEVKSRMNNDSQIESSVERRVLQQPKSLEVIQHVLTNDRELNQKVTRDSFGRSSNKDFNQPMATKAKHSLLERESRIEFAVNKHHLGANKFAEVSTTTDRLKRVATSSGMRMPKVQSQSSLFRTKGSSGNLSYLQQTQTKRHDVSAADRRLETNVAHTPATELSKSGAAKAEIEASGIKRVEGSQYMSKISLPVSLDTRAGTKPSQSNPKFSGSIATFQRKGALT